jgi:hypothetical protein
MTGLALVENLLEALGATALFAVAVLVVLGSGHPEDRAAAALRLAGPWRLADQLAFGALCRRALAGLAATADRLVADHFERADRSAGFAAVVIAIVGVFIPVAAVVNALIGGRPLLAGYVGSVALALVVLGFVTEVRRLSLLSQALAFYVGISLVAVVPAYVFRSFQDRILRETIGHAVLESLLVAPLCYIVAYAVLVFLDAAVLRRGPDSPPAPAATALHRFLAAVPVAYVLVHFAALAGHLAVATPQRFMTWPMFLSSVGFTALAFPLSRGLVGMGLRAGTGGLIAVLAATVGAGALLSILAFVAARLPVGSPAGLDVASAALIGREGGRLYLGPDFWLTHLPLAPALLILAGIAAAALAKGVAAVFGLAGASAGGRPVLAGIVFFLTVAGGAFGAAALL